MNIDIDINDTRSRYNIKTNKILNENQTGTLLPIFNHLFPDVQFEKRGVHQTCNSFFNAISIILDKDPSSLKNDIIHYLNENKNTNLFHVLDDGNVFFKYKTINEYITKIKDEKNCIDLLDILDLLKIIYSINIIIFDIPLLNSKSEKLVDEKNIKLVCYKNGLPDSKKPFAILFKTENKFEVMSLQNKCLFNYNESSGFENIIKFYLESCKQRNIYPENYKTFNYTPLMNAREVVKALADTENAIKFQVVDKLFKIHILITKTNICLPVNESTMINSLQVLNEKDVPLLTYQDYSKQALATLNNELQKNNLPELIINEITLNKKGLITNFGGFIIPIKPSITTDHINTNKYINYYNWEDYSKLPNEYIEFNEKLFKVHQELQDLKIKLSYIIGKSNKLQNYILNIQKSYSKMSKFEIISMYNEVFKKIIDSVYTRYSIKIKTSLAGC